MEQTGILEEAKVYTPSTIVSGISSGDFVRLPRESVPMFWDCIIDIVERKGKGVLEYMDLKDLYRSLLEGQIELWLGVDKIGKVELLVACMWEEHPKLKNYHLMWVGGNNVKGYFKEGLKAIEKYAMIMGAQEVVVTPRPGWRKILKNAGYFDRKMVMGKSVRVLYS